MSLPLLLLALSQPNIANADPKKKIRSICAWVLSIMRINRNEAEVIAPTLSGNSSVAEILQFDRQQYWQRRDLPTDPHLRKPVESLTKEEMRSVILQLQTLSRRETEPGGLSIGLQPVVDGPVETAAQSVDKTSPKLVLDDRNSPFSPAIYVVGNRIFLGPKDLSENGPQLWEVIHPEIKKRLSEWVVKNSASTPEKIPGVTTVEPAKQPQDNSPLVSTDFEYGNFSTVEYDMYTANAWDMRHREYVGIKSGTSLLSLAKKDEFELASNNWRARPQIAALEHFPQKIEFINEQLQYLLAKTTREGSTSATDMELRQFVVSIQKSIASGSLTVPKGSKLFTEGTISSLRENLIKMWTPVSDPNPYYNRDNIIETTMRMLSPDEMEALKPIFNEQDPFSPINPLVPRNSKGSRLISMSMESYLDWLDQETIKHNWSVFTPHEQTILVNLVYQRITKELRLDPKTDVYHTVKKLAYNTKAIADAIQAGVINPLQIQGHILSGETSESLRSALQKLSAANARVYNEVTDGLKRFVTTTDLQKVGINPIP